MPTLDELESRWQPSSRQVIRAMKEWRRQHPKATFQEIESALDRQLAQLRAEMLRDLALTSPKADLTQTPPPSVRRARAVALRWKPTVNRLAPSRPTMTKRSSSCAVMPLARSAGPGFFPLDEELALLPGALTPALHEALVRLSTRLQFRQAVEELARLKQVTTSEATARRHTEAAGGAYVAWQTAEVERLERTLPAPPSGPARQLVSPDGAMVPLVHKEWAEVKTVAIGAIQPPVQQEGELVVKTTELSYFSRLADAESFTHLATVETQRRGTERAQTVCAVSDGAEWIQGFFDMQCQSAVRILDFYHAAGYIAQVGQAQLGEGTPEFNDWLSTTLHELKTRLP